MVGCFEHGAVVLALDVPTWSVELYVNRIVVAIVKTDPIDFALILEAKVIVFVNIGVVAFVVEEVLYAILEATCAPQTPSLAIRASPHRRLPYSFPKIFPMVLADLKS